MASAQACRLGLLAQRIGHKGKIFVATSRIDKEVGYSYHRIVVDRVSIVVAPLQWPDLRPTAIGKLG